MIKKKLAVLILALGLVLPYAATATVGVGIGIGKIRVNDILKPGVINILPSITVINNGDEPSDYKVWVMYHTEQEEREDMGLKPPKEWFVFKPNEFYLEPGKVQVVEISLNLPINAKPGKYFAFLEARPIKKVDHAGTSIGVASAAKLWFEVAAANIFWGIFYRALSLYKMYSFWTNWVAAILTTVIVISILRKFLKFNVQLRGKSPQEPSTEEIVKPERQARSRKKNT